MGVSSRIVSEGELQQKESRLSVSGIIMKNIIKKQGLTKKSAKCTRNYKNLMHFAVLSF